MKILSWLGVVCVALMLSSCGSTGYGSDTRSSRTNDVIDFNGDWQLVNGRSNTDNRGWYDEQSHFNAEDWGNAAGRNRNAAWFLPDAFRLDATGDEMRFTDLNGDVIADVVVTNDYRNGSYDDHGYASNAQARWIDSRLFEVERLGPGDRRIVHTFSLENRGHELVVTTRIERDGGTRTYTRDYQRM